ncbi:MAG: CRTAC1 family protein [Maritimibacter sp.]|nr:CRTAC1 family protein [Maritimibacter sp.]
MLRVLLVAALPGAALAGPAFIPGEIPDHVYDGGWEHFVGGGVAVFDCSGDGLPEIFAAGGENPAALFLNASEAPGGALRFVASDLAPIDHVVGAYPLDIDSDGRLDLAVLRVGPNLLLKGGPDCAFTDATADWGLATDDRWTTAFSATWEPGQDWPTLAFGNYVDRNDPEGPFEACDVNQLYRPGPEGYGAAKLLDPGFCPLSILFADWRRRGRADLWLSNDRHYYVRGGYEQMYRPDEDRFLGEADGWDKVSIWGMGIAARDLNADGRPEVMLTSMGDQLLRFATETGYRTAGYETGATAHRPYDDSDGRPSTGWHAAFGDVDNDGHEDIFIAKGNVDQMPDLAFHDPNNLLMGQADGSFVEAGGEAGIGTKNRSRGAALADLNGDGLLDLVVMNRRAPMELWQNATGDTGHWVAVDPRQTGANSQAVGAWVELRAGAFSEVQERTVGGGHAGGSAVPMHFGLGAEAAPEVRVVWPDGSATDWQAVPLDAATVITRDE